MTHDQRVWTVLAMLEWATKFFRERNVEDPRLSIEWLLSEVLQVKRLDLYLQYDRPLATSELDQLRSLVKRRAQHEPLQYITGSTQFMDVTIHVDKRVLIPRIETEQLTDLLLEHTATQKSQNLRLIDLGTGSGCIPIAIKKKRPDWDCFAIDISEGAIELARENARINETDVRFEVQDLFECISKSSGKWDIVISNPPYITESEKDQLHEQVLKYEPGGALFYSDPIHLYEKIIQFAAANQAHLFLECNDKTANRVAEIAALFYKDADMKKDLDGNDRFVLAADVIKQSN